MGIKEKLFLISEKSKEDIAETLEDVENILLHDILEIYNKKERNGSIDLNFGKLNIFFESGQINYKFIPDKKFKKKVLRILKNKKDPLTEKIEKKIVSKIFSVYSDVVE